MKINHKNTALDFLENPETMDFYMPEYHKPLSLAERLQCKQQMKSAFVNAKNENMHIFKDRICYITRPFALAYEKSRQKLMPFFFKEIFDECGTLIYSSGSFTTTIFYSIDTFMDEKNEWDCNLTFLQFSKNAQADQKALDVYIHKRSSEVINLVWEGHYKEKMDWIHFMSWLVTFLCFIKYCEVEVKVVEPSRKAHHKGEKYVNETKEKIQILDSTWFTTITTSKGFTVGGDEGGFFRMQQYGPGNNLRRLQWIPAFEKQGYTRTAKVSTQ